MRILRGKTLAEKHQEEQDKKRTRKKADRLRREMLKVNRAAPGLPENIEIRTNTKEP